MDAPINICRECRKDVSQSVAAGEAICPWCGCSFKAADNGGMTRGWLWALFWAVFLGTPAVTLVSISSGAGIPLFITGAIFSGYILARLFAKNKTASVLMTIVFTGLLLVVYGGIAFAGCLVMMQGAHF
ncbi:MAG: hypothetical protein JWQ04_1941 [Pedosphaera sp.]|nr:hypothetical protein [Pedosphaera sp.]